LPTSLVGQTLGHYKILDQLGAGGMGVVYRAQDLKLGRQVALKVLPTGNTASEESVERFRREARTASSLNHPNICTVYGFDEHDGQLYLAMELLDGEPLDRKLSGRPIDLKLVLDIGAQVADALDAAHAEGILHRDIKPANIFLTRRGPVKVLDFGLAKLSPEYKRRSGRMDAHQETAPPEHFTSVVGTTVGTIAYMSPEQARGDEVDPRTDLFSFGVVLYEMATGKQSFPGHTTAVVFDGILNRDPAPPSTHNANLPAELDRIVSKALEKDRGLRYQTAADLGADLKRLRRDSNSRGAVIAASSANVAASAATVMMPSSAETMIGGGSGISAAPTVITPSAAQLPPSDPSTVLRAAAKKPLMWGAAAGILAIAAIAAGMGAYFANRGGAPPAATPEQPATAAAALTPAPTATPAAAAPAPPAPAAPDKPAAPGNTTKPPVQAAPASTAAAARTTKAAPAAAAPVSRDAEAARLLEVAKAKLVNNLTDQALADLRHIIVEFPASKSAAESAFLAAEIHEKTGKLDDAMAAYIEFESRFSKDSRVADAKLHRSAILARQRQAKSQELSLQLLNDVVRDFPGTPQAQQALQTKLRIETDRRELRAIDPVTKQLGPAALATLRTFLIQFPDGPEAMVARNRLAMMLSQMNRHAEAAQVLEDMGAHGDNPMDVWWRLGELYERRLNDPVKARVAYAKVPQGSPRYNDAQKKLNKK
jgi:serine/threonine protein kinase/TolA-binding protein